MRRVTAGFIGLACGIAIGAGSAQRWGSDILAGLAATPQPVATIIAAVLGFGVIAWQARLGFNALIKAQDHRAAIEERARRNQDTINRDLAFDQKLREKFEEVLQLLHEHDHWLDNQRRRWAFGDESAPFAPDPLPRARALVSVYFPVLEDPLASLARVSLDYQTWNLEAGQKRLRGELDTMNDGFVEANRRYVDQHWETFRIVREYGREQLPR